MSAILEKVSRKFVKNIDGYKTFNSLKRVTHNHYGIRFRNFRNRMLSKCGSIKRIYDYAIYYQISRIEVFFYSRRGNLYTCFIDFRGY